MLTLEHEKNLVKRAKYSSEAFAELFDMYYKLIFGYVLRRTAEIEISRDITSAVFLEALHHINKYEWRGISISHWFYRIANHEIIDHYKKQKHICAVQKNTYIEGRLGSLQDELVLANYELKKNEDFLDLHASLTRLPVKYQEVLVLRYFEDKDIKEVAMILGKPEGTVKSLLHRGTEILRKMLER